MKLDVRVLLVFADMTTLALAVQRQRVSPYLISFRVEPSTQATTQM